MKLALIAAAALAGAHVTGAGFCREEPEPAKERLQKALDDELQGAWVYDDITTGFRTAKKTGKPMLVVFR